jgi:DNA-binding MarR family transcriptional regulator
MEDLDQAHKLVMREWKAKAAKQKPRISYARYKVLRAIICKGLETSLMISEDAGLDMTTASGLLLSMNLQGLLSREPLDHRMYSWKATKKGQMIEAAYRETMDEMNAMASNIVQGLNAKPLP